MQLDAAEGGPDEENMLPPPQWAELFNSVSLV